MWRNLTLNTSIHAPKWIQTIRNQRLLAYSQSIAIQYSKRYLSITPIQLKSPRKSQEDIEEKAEAEEEENASLWTPEERERYRIISEWQAKFTREKIPYRTFETSYMRSSGPGGQNVNKLSTKVDMRFELQYASWLPEAVREKLGQQEATRLNKHGELVFTSDRTRSQKMNLEDCIDKLYDAILRASQVPKEPDAEQQAKVKRMKEAEKRRRKEDKQRRSDKKASRRSRHDD